MENGLFEIFVFLVAACVTVPLTSRFKLGSVLGYLIAGIVIGPYALRLISSVENVMTFAEFGVVMMLFVIGLELEPAILWRLRKSIVGLGGLQVVLTAAVFTGIGTALGFGWQVSLAAGMALALSSTALVMQMLEEKNLVNTAIGQTSFSILLFQDIAVIPILVLMPLLAGTDAGDTAAAHASMIAHLPAYAKTLIVAGVIAAVIVAARYLSRYLFVAVARTRLREIFTALSLALVVGITLLMQTVGVSPALGAFIAGLALASSEYRRTLEADIEPFKGLLLGLFFISVGMSVDFGLFAAAPVPIMLAVVTLMAVKAAILWGLGRMFKNAPMHNIGYAFALSQGGEFAFVLFKFSGSLSILAPEQVQFLTLVVALSIAATPLLMAWYSRFIVPKFMSLIPEKTYDVINENNPIILAGYGRFGQVVGRFLNAQGVKVTVLEKDPDQIELLRKFGFDGYFGDASRLDLLRSAGIEKAKLLIVAVDDVETSLDIIRQVREEFPKLAIFARARNRQHAYELHKLGVDRFKRELFDSSLNMAREIMVWLGSNESEILHRAEQFRQHDEDTLKDSFQFFEDEPALVNFAKTRRAELERILKNDSSENEKKRQA